MDLGQMLVNIPNPTLSMYELGLTRAENKINRDMMFTIEGEYSAITTAGAIFNELIAVESVLDKIVANGEPLHPSTKKFVEVTLRPAYRTLGLKKSSYIPGMETVKNSSGSIAMASICLEEVQDTIKKIAIKLAKLMDFIWKKIKEFVRHVLERLGVVVESLKNVMDRAEQLSPDAKPFEDFINSVKPGLESSGGDSFLRNHLLFAINGVCEGSTAEKIIENTVTLLNANRLIIIEMMKGLELIATKRPTHGQVVDEANRLVSEVKEKMRQFTQTERKSKANQVIYSYGYFHDNTLFKLTEDIGKSHVDDEVRLFNIDLEMVRDEKTDEDFKVRVLTRDEMLKIGRDTVNLVNKTKDFDKVVPIVEKTIKKTTDHLHYDFVETEDKDRRNDIMTSLQLIRDIFQYVKKYLPKISSSAIEVAADATVYVRSSVARYEMNK